VVAEVRVMQRVGDDGDAQGLRIVAESLFDLAAVRKRWARRLKLSFNGNADVGKLEDLLRPFRGEGVPITVRFGNDRIDGEVDFGEGWRVAPDPALIDRLREWLEPANVEVVY